MKTFVAATLITLASVATAQLSAIPSCALNCFLGPLGSDGCPSLEDFACHCAKSDSLLASVTPCVQKACSSADQAATISAVEETCAQAGVTIVVPSPGASSTPAPSSAPESETPTPTENPTEIPTATEEVTSVVTSEVVVPTSAPSSGIPTPTGNGTSPTGSASPSVSEFPGAAARATQAAGLLAAAGLAIFAL